MVPRIILITGAAGFVGKHLQEAIVQRMPNARLCLMDHPSSGICGAGITVEYEDETFRVSADLTCNEDSRLALEALAKKVGVPDMVFHLAARAEVARSLRAPSDTYNTNVVGTARLLEALSDLTNTCRVLIPSSAQVYAAAALGAPAAGAAAPSETAGPTAAEPTAPSTIRLLNETAPIGPSSHYGVSKFAQEEVGRLFYETIGLPVLITRAFNHTGPGQSTGFVVPDFARQIALLEREAVAARARVGNLDTRRDYLDVRDVVDAYLVVMEQGEPGRPYNVASGITWSARELLHMLTEMANIEVEIEVDQRLMRPLDVSYSAGDATRLRALGWTPSRDIRDTIKETLDYWRRMTGARLKPRRAL